MLIYIFVQINENNTNLIIVLKINIINSFDHKNDLTKEINIVDSCNIFNLFLLIFVLNDNALITV